MLRARINGLVFNGTAATGFVISPDGWKGWDEGADVRRDETNRPTSHGAFDAPGYLSPRVTTIAGHVLAPSSRELRHLCAQLTGLLADGDSGRLVVDTDKGIEWANVRLAARTAVTVNGATRTDAEFQISFWSADMRKYGAEHVFGPTSGTVRAYQYGNFPALPVVEITGSLPSGYTVTSQGKTFKVSQPLTSGQTHRLDMRRGWLFRNNVLQSGAVDVAESFTIPPDVQPQVVFTPASGSGQMTVTVTDTFI